MFANPALRQTSIPYQDDALTAGTPPHKRAADGKLSRLYTRAFPPLPQIVSISIGPLSLKMDL